jgi:hypothetical protein
MKYVLSPGYIISLIIPAFFLISSCQEKESESTGDPSNLLVEITLPESGPGIVLIQAHADNAVEYQLFIGEEEEPAAVNETGQFEHEFSKAGDYHIEVRAYGTSGRFIKEVKQFSIEEDDPVTIDEGFTTPLEYPGLQMVWNDEFDGSGVDFQKWTFETGAGGWGNNELEYYRAENAWIEGGTLTIEARKENYQGSNYTSARMKTENKWSFQYGRVDIRALLPKGQGIWPALWMLGNNIGSVGWPKCGELDIMEMIGGSGRENTVYGTVHWDDNGHVEYGGDYKLGQGTFADEYHVFTVIWDENVIKWYVNDIKYCEVDITPAHMTEFHQPFFFIFNLAVGGNWPGYPNTSTVFPQQLKVDYIRVFQE